MGIEEQELTASGNSYTAGIHKCVLETQDLGVWVVLFYYFIYLFME